MNQLTFRIAGLLFAVYTPYCLKVSEEYIPFLTKDGNPDWSIRVSETLSIPVQRDFVFSNYSQVVYNTDNGYIRCFRSAPHSEEYYGYMQLNSAESISNVWYLPEKEKNLDSVFRLVSRAALEEVLINRDRIVLHAALIDTTYGGILFSGPSGIGKSTQADLWCRYENSKLINGDRPILQKTESGWYAWGSPYSGFSHCYVNKGVPVRAVILLEQGKRCYLERVSTAESFRQLYAQTMVNTWNEAFVAKVCDMLMKMVCDIPIYHLVCTPDRDAVEILRTELRKGVD